MHIPKSFWEIFPGKVECFTSSESGGAGQTDSRFEIFYKMFSDAFHDAVHPNHLYWVFYCFVEFNQREMESTAKRQMASHSLLVPGAHSVTSTVPPLRATEFISRIRLAYRARTQLDWRASHWVKKWSHLEVNALRTKTNPLQKPQSFPGGSPTPAAPSQPPERGGGKWIEEPIHSRITFHRNTLTLLAAASQPLMFGLFYSLYKSHYSLLAFRGDIQLKTLNWSKAENGHHGSEVMVVVPSFWWLFERT